MPVSCLDNFRTHPYISNFFNGRNEITNFQKYQIAHRDIVHETFNAKIFLEACGIDCEPKYSITKLQLTQLLKNNEEGNEQLVSADLRAWFPDAFKKELEAGRWYTPCNKYEGIALLRFENPKNKHSCGYGFDFKGEWTKIYSIIASDRIVFRESTSQEVEAALISEAKKRGFKKGVRYLSAWNNEAYCIYPQDLYYNAKKNCLATHNGNECVFQNGQWATIIQPEKMTLEQIEKELGRKIEIV